MNERFENERAEEEKEDFSESNMGFHFDKLHDQNESAAGDRIDPKTGNLIRNDEGVQSPHAIETEDRQGLQAIKKELKDDVTTKWLLENGYDEMGNELPKKKVA